MNPKAEEIRIRYLNRRKVLTGEVKVRLAAARRLVGPDCAYHLYGILKAADLEEDKPRSGIQGPKAKIK